jgi:hypothetical protein
MQGKANSATVFDLGTALPQQHVNLEVDHGRQREYGRWMLVGLVLLGALLFNVWQRNDPVNRGRRLEELETRRKQEAELGRALQLQVLTLSAPDVIEFLAVNRLHMVEPGADDQVVLRRFVAPPQPPSSVVALR